MLKVVLVEPEIPGNTGNSGRSCVAAGAELHLVGRLGFNLSERRIKRAGMDYWPKLKLTVHGTWESFLASLPKDAVLRGFAPGGKASLWDAPFGPDDYLLFGSESTGLTAAALAACGDRLYRIPMRPEARSLNLSSSVAVALYEASRKVNKNMDFSVGQ